jgi:parallel beta-helix repeat protein
MRGLKKINLIFCALLLVFAFQNCTVSKFSKLNSDNILAGLQSNDGHIFDGKLRILHHLVDGFTCEGRQVPEAILIRDSNTTWKWIQNTKEKCDFVEKTIYAGVVYDEATKKAQFEGKTYLPPKPYFVSATENPHLPDVNNLDGICADVNGICSLQAALEQTTTTSLTEPVIVNIPAGRYKLSQVLKLNVLSDQSFPVQIKGQDKATTLIDGNLATAQLSVRSLTKSLVSIENLTFVNGWDGVGLNGSSIQISSSEYYIDDVKYPDANISVSDCLFQHNMNSSAVIHVHPSSGSLQVHRSQFIANIIGGIQSQVANGLFIEDSSFDFNGGRAVLVSDNTGAVTIINSTFSNNYEGINLLDCRQCNVENTTLYGNRNRGIVVMTTKSDPLFDVSLNHVTLFKNGDLARSAGWPVANLSIGFTAPTNSVTMTNSILGEPSYEPTMINCDPWNSPGFTHRLISTNSIFSDATCSQSGTGNLTVDPLLSLLADNGGYSPTMMPAAGSPAIDAASDLFCTAKDQRGLIRVKSQCDIGAVEVSK